MLDPEGQTIGRALQDLGWDEVRDVRAGRLIRLRIEAPGAEAADREVRRMCEELIANPVIEDYEVRVDPAGDAGSVPSGREAGPR